VSVTSTRTVSAWAEPQEEVPAWHAPVANGVRGELGNKQGERVMRLGGVRDTPGVQTLGAEATGKAGAPRSGAEPHLEMVAGVAELRGLGLAHGVARHVSTVRRGGVA